MFLLISLMILSVSKTKKCASSWIMPLLSNSGLVIIAVSIRPIVHCYCVGPVPKQSTPPASAKSAAMRSFKHRGCRFGFRVKYRKPIILSRSNILSAICYEYSLLSKAWTMGKYGSFPKWGDPNIGPKIL